MKTKQQLIYCLIITINLITSACESKPKETRESIIRKCLAVLKKDGPGSKYIVSPKFNDFEFNSYLRKNYPKSDIDWKTEETLLKLNWSKSDYIKIQSEINKEFSGKYDYSLTKLSNTEMSNFVISFSGVHENLVFAEIICYCDAVKPADLNENFFNQSHRFMNIGSINFVIKNGTIYEIPDNGIALEYQCQDSDKQIINY